MGSANRLILYQIGYAGVLAVVLLAIAGAAALLSIIQKRSPRIRIHTVASTSEYSRRSVEINEQPMNWNLLTGFFVILSVFAVAYVYHAPHHEAAAKRIMLVVMLGLIGFWQIYLKVVVVYFA